MPTNAVKYSQTYLASHQERYAKMREEAYAELIAQYNDELGYRKLLIEREKALLAALERLQRETGRQTGDSDVDLNKLRLELAAITEQNNSLESAAQRRIAIKKEQSDKLAVPDAAQRKISERNEIMATQGGLIASPDAAMQMVMQTIDDVAGTVQGGTTNAAGTAQQVLKSLEASGVYKKLDGARKAEVKDYIRLGFGLDTVNIGGVAGAQLLEEPQDVLIEKETEKFLKSEGGAYGVGKLGDFIDRLKGAKTDKEVKDALEKIVGAPAFQSAIVKIEQGKDPNDPEALSPTEREAYEAAKIVSQQLTLPRDFEKYFDPQWIEKRQQILEQYGVLTGVQEEIKRRSDKGEPELPSEEAVRKRAAEKYRPEAAERLREQFERDSYAGDDLKLRHYDAIQAARSAPIKSDDAAYKAAASLLSNEQAMNTMKKADLRTFVADAAAKYGGENRNERDKFMIAYHQIQLKKEGDMKGPSDVLPEKPDAPLPRREPMKGPLVGGPPLPSMIYEPPPPGTPPKLEEKIGKQIGSLPSMSDLFKQSF